MKIRPVETPDITKSIGDGGLRDRLKALESYCKGLEGVNDKLRDRIEELEKDRDEAWNLAVYSKDDPSKPYFERTRADEAEAAVAKLREKLEALAAWLGDEGALYAFGIEAERRLRALIASAQEPAGTTGLRAALKEAIELIRGWHGMGHGDDEPRVWELYQQSPEMKRLNAALTAHPPKETKDA